MAATSPEAQRAQPIPKNTIPTEEFARDIWEAMRDEVREQLGTSVTDQGFESSFPHWDKLSVEDREKKVMIARDELLKVLDRAGYQVRKKVQK